VARDLERICHQHMYNILFYLYCLLYVKRQHYVSLRYTSVLNYSQYPNTDFFIYFLVHLLGIFKVFFHYFAFHIKVLLIDAESCISTREKKNSDWRMPLILMNLDTVSFISMIIIVYLMNANNTFSVNNNYIVYARVAKNAFAHQ